MKILILLAATLSSALSGDNRSPQLKYIEQYAPVAVQEMQRSGVPASITLAQGMVESDAGQSELARFANNHFGIKCHNDWNGGTYRVDDDAKSECFRSYPHAEDSFRDHSDFLRYYDRYSSLFLLSPYDYKGWSYGLKKAGYATDPSYPSKLIRVIEDYKLYQYDKVDEGDIPQAPALIEAHRPLVEEHRYSMSRKVYQNNGVAFVYAVQGETMESIASSNKLLLKEILLFNDLKSVRELKDGEIVYLQLKKAQAEKGLDKYVVSSDGESLRDIAQRFAVRVKSISKLNGFDADAVCLREGDMIKLRK